MPDLYDLFGSTADSGAKPLPPERQHAIVDAVSSLAAARRRRRVAANTGVTVGALAVAGGLGWTLGMQAFSADDPVASAPTLASQPPTASDAPPSPSQQADVWDALEPGWFVAVSDAADPADGEVLGVIAPSGLLDERVLGTQAGADARVMAWHAGRALVWSPSEAEGRAGTWSWWVPTSGLEEIGPGAAPTSVLGVLGDGRWVQADAGSAFSTLSVVDEGVVTPLCDTAPDTVATALSVDGATVVCFEPRGDNTDVVVVDLHDGVEKRLAATLSGTAQGFAGVGWLDESTLAFASRSAAGVSFSALDVVTLAIEDFAVPAGVASIHTFHARSGTFTVVDTDGVSVVDAQGSRLARVDCEGSRESARVVVSGYRGIVRCPAVAGSGWVDTVVDLSNGGTVALDTAALGNVTALLPVRD